MASEIKMVVVDGVRYRPEHAPERADETPAPEEKAAPAPKNKARTASNKKG